LRIVALRAYRCVAGLDAGRLDSAQPAASSAVLPKNTMYRLLCYYLLFKRALVLAYAIVWLGDDHY
jgi:hypothetical protein